MAFFREVGVPLHEEPGGKLFPDSNSARDVLNALLTEAERLGVKFMNGTRVSTVVRDGDPERVAPHQAVAPQQSLERVAPQQSVAPYRLRVVTKDLDLLARRVVLATGGQSLPKSGSDGKGFEIARRLGHTIVPTTPALVPLLVKDEKHAMHRALSGVAHEAELTLWVDDAVEIRLSGALLWTHFGISGPLALNMSRHWLRATLAGGATLSNAATLSSGATLSGSPALTLNFCPGETFDNLERWWTARTKQHPQTSVATQLSTRLPASVAAKLLEQTGIDGAITLAHFARDDRRRLSHALVKWPLAVTGNRGYTYAEVTAGGVSLDEIDPATMRSRVCDGLSLVGEILDVDGRIGGFNFQWAWSSAHVAAQAVDN